MKIPKKLGLVSIILLGINSIIGSGIFLLPGQIMALMEGWSLLVYLFVTLVVLAIGSCYASCASLFNRNGGGYLYAKEAFGNFIGFEIGMMKWAVGIISWASLATGFATVAGLIWPQVNEEGPRTLLILSLVGGLGILNAINFQMVSLINNALTVAKLLLFVFFIIVGLFFVQKTHFMQMPIPELDVGTFGSASLLVFYVFGGFETIGVAAGEMENPQKNLPIAMLGGILFSSALYFMIQFIAIGALGDRLSVSQAPMADVAVMALGPIGAFAINFVMLLSIGGVNLTSSFLTPRYGQALADDGMIPKLIAEKNRFGAPYISILLTVLLTGWIAVSGSFLQLIALSVVSRFAQHISTCLAVLVLNKNRMTLSTLIMPVLGLVGIFWLMSQASFYHLTYIFGALLLGIPFYFFQKRDHKDNSELVPEKI